ncbi:protein OXIDATIVE STRESS 3 LIKE 5-like [Actinidia eriantha]|uniref:protein OXIDATIVE STRESS 3 LIKE 5-like n=1 Tax=Actinidia eriantha TaxID=165200 RepID=UPI00259046B9|nr:protein OXIDATIVE STRESS 3 LIKE 5-like [Actinidia eriantha]
MSVVFDGTLALGLDAVSPPATTKTEVEASSESSSIGDDSDADNGDGEAVSKIKGTDLFCLEESDVPVARGLSKYYLGKSKSFVNLLEVKTVKEIEKRESPLNKRRRMMIAHKRSNNKSTTSMPLQQVQGHKAK